MYEKVLQELKNIKNTLFQMNFEELNIVIDDMLDIIKSFGEQIESNGITNEQDIEQLKNILQEKPNLFIDILWDNLSLLISEYEKIILLKNENSIIDIFNDDNNNFAFIKDENSNHYFINEDIQTCELAIKSIKNETEAIILIGYGAGTLHQHFTKKFVTLTVDAFRSNQNLQLDNVIFDLNQNNMGYLHQKLDIFIGLKTEVIIHPQYKHSRHIIEVLTTIKNLLNSDNINLNTRVMYTENWYKEILINARYLLKNNNRIVNIDNLKNQYKNSDALIIAGGPSLEDALLYLKKYQSDYYIIAIGQTVKVLLENSINPDFIISIDTSEANVHFFNNLELTVPLVYPLQLNHKIPEKSKDILIPYADVPLTKDILDYSRTTFNTYSTVALSAVEFANYLGFKSIGLIGQDLALREGEYYSPSVKTVASNNGQFSDQLFDITLNNGEYGKTTLVLFNFLNAYRSMLRSFPELKNKLVNHSKFGAVIDDVPYKSLKTLKLNKIKKQKLYSDNKIKSIEISLDSVKKLFNSNSEHLSLINKKVNRSLQQKAISINEFEKILREWDKMIEFPYFRTHIMPLQLVNLLIIQNKIRLHNLVRKNNDVRLHILYLMKMTIDELIRQIDEIQNQKIEV